MKASNENIPMITINPIKLLFCKMQFLKENLRKKKEKYILLVYWKLVVLDQKFPINKFTLSN
ncbi:hypothetical protein T03_16864 [Trichinella britovi]|uniref:Uncharacterized protein n=1 Tax=Trichinella britovi TaxID=45882 RepID=A0A0V1CX66_TRIBR|nr:hypothetical protein T03_16864 [Trichinella britovi]